MTITITELALYSGALLILFLTPGPVWVAIVARAVSGGTKSAIPLAFGVALGDILWPLVAIFGVTAIVSVYADFLVVLRYAAAVILALMGLALIRFADKVISSNNAFTAPGAWAGFLAGVLAVTANPKASLFYLALLPTFFDFTNISAFDVILICTASFLVPLLGNILLASFVGQMRKFLASPAAVKRTNIGAGIALILVGVVIALT